MYDYNRPHRYSLDRRTAGHTPRKYRCPQCGQRTLSPYIDWETGQPLDPAVCGKCDRLLHCCYHLPPREYFKLHPDAASRRPLGGGLYTAEPPRHSCVSRALLTGTLGGYEGNTLARWLHSVFDTYIGAENVDRVLRDYLVGTTPLFGGSPVFWQVTPSGEIRTGKVIGYGHDGRRVRCPKPLMHWMHHGLKDFRLRQCWFGSHRVQDSSQTLLVMESEKGALMTAMALMTLGERCYQGAIPLATGGCGGLCPTVQRLTDPDDAHAVLAGHPAVLLPDEGKYREWLEKSQLLQRVCPSVTVSDMMENPGELAYKPNPGDGPDDALLRNMTQGLLPLDLGDVPAACISAPFDW